MRAVKFMVVDILKCKVQLLFMAAFAPLAFLFMMRSISPLNGVFYMSFAAVIVGIQPFMQEQSAEVGFLYMLPGTKRDRVAGRYLFGMLLQAVAAVLSVIAVTVYGAIKGTSVTGMAQGMGLCFCIGLIFCALQYILFYALGRIKSQQMAAIIMMLPGFLMFFGISFLLEYGISYIGPYIEWMQANTEIAFGTLAVLSLMIWGAGILIAGAIMKKRDDV